METTTVGQISKADLAGLRPLIQNEDVPTFMPGKPGYEAGATLAGRFVESKKVVSDKLTTSKRDENGNKYAMLHVLRDNNGNKFGIWGKGQLDALLKRVRADQLVAITYLGVADAPLEKGQSAPHQFEIRGE